MPKKAGCPHVWEHLDTIGDARKKTYLFYCKFCLKIEDVELLKKEEGERNAKIFSAQEVAAS